MSSPELNEKQKAFAREYAFDFNATQAAIRAGYSEKTAKQIGSRLLTNVDVQRAVQHAINARQKRTEIDQDYVLYGIREVIERCKQAEKVLDNQGEPTGEYRFEANAALKGFELLGKKLKLWTEKHEVRTESLTELTDDQLVALAQRLSAGSS